MSTDIDRLINALNPGRKVPLKTVFLAIILTIIGVTFLTIGVFVFHSKTLSDAGPFLCIGLVTFIPGSYASAVLYMAYMGYPGYTYSLVPQFED